MRDDLHQARWRRSGVRYRAGRGQHRNVEAQCDVLFAGVVHAPYVIGLRFVCDQFRMFLYDQHEASLALRARENTNTLYGKCELIITLRVDCMYNYQRGAFTATYNARKRMHVQTKITHVNVYESAVSKIDFENFGLGRRVLRHRHDTSALFVFAVAFHVQHSVESLFRNMDFHLYPV